MQFDHSGKSGPGLGRVRFVLIRDRFVAQDVAVHFASKVREFRKDCHDVLLLVR